MANHLAGICREILNKVDTAVYDAYEQKIFSLIEHRGAFSHPTMPPRRRHLPTKHGFSNADIAWKPC